MRHRHTRSWAHLLPDIANALAKPFLLLIAAFIVSPRVGIGLTILTIAAILLYSGMSGETQFMNYYQQALERLSAESVEYVRGIQVVKIFHADARSFKALYEAVRDYSKFALDYSMSCKVPWVLLQWAMFGIVAIIVPFYLSAPGSIHPRNGDRGGAIDAHVFIRSHVFYDHEGHVCSHVFLQWCNGSGETGGYV